MFRLVIHSTFLLLLAFAGTASGMVLCVGHAGDISLEARCDEAMCGVSEMDAPEHVSCLENGGPHCVDIPLPDSKLANLTRHDAPGPDVAAPALTGAFLARYPDLEAPARTIAPAFAFPKAPAPARTSVLLI